MDLYVREYGVRSSVRPSLVLLHGLFGSSSNWHSIARALEGEYHLLVPDLRNHGRSPHSSSISYPEMASDVARLIQHYDLGSVSIVGHSMGGKTAMWLALDRPELVDRLVVVDIAPVTYSHDFKGQLDGIAAVDLTALNGREQADEMMSQQLDDRRLRQYLLQNLIKSDGRWQWRINTKALTDNMSAIVGFPIGGIRQYSGKTLFVYGSESDYVNSDNQRKIRILFPHARIRMIAAAGHWLYAEQPDHFIDVVGSFFKSS